MTVSETAHPSGCSEQIGLDPIMSAPDAQLSTYIFIPMHCMEMPSLRWALAFPNISFRNLVFPDYKLIL